MSTSSRMLKKFASFVLVHPLHKDCQRVPVGPSTYHKEYASAPRVLRPRWTNFLTILERKEGRILLLGLVLVGTVAVQALELRGEGGVLGLGRPAEEAEVQAWNIEVSPFGDGLPSGSGTAKQGAKVFAAKCASCHGPKGIEGPAPRLVGGIGTLATAEPVKTVGSYWPYATTLYDYVYRTMPMTAPQSLKPDEVYAVSAWILAQNGIIQEDRVMDAATLPKVEMPNRHGFVPDPRPDIP